MEFMTAQPGGGFLVARTDDELVGYVVVTRFPGDGRAGGAVGGALARRPRRGPRAARALLAGSPTPELGRLVVAVGRPADLTLFTEFGVMPVSGHWHMRHRVDRYLEQRAQEPDATEPGRARAHAGPRGGGVEAARAGWRSGTSGPPLHEFFGRTRNCLATVDAEPGHATGALLGQRPTARSARPWARSPEDLVPVVLAALDRVAKTQEPETSACTAPPRPGG